MNKESVTRLIDRGAVVREIELGRHTLYCRDVAFIIHDTRRKRASERVVFTGHDEAEAIGKLLDLAAVCQ